jgi:hypothetical protein
MCGWLLYRDFQRPDPKRPDPNRDLEHADIRIRNFLNVRWLGGDYELPADVEHCGLGVLMIEDGKYVDRHPGTVFSPWPGGSRVVPYYVMWGPNHKGTTRLIYGWPGSWASSDGDEFFAHLDGGAYRQVGSPQLEEYRGYHVIGYAFSREARQGQEEKAKLFGSLQLALESRKYVAILGLKTFSTRHDADSWYTGRREPADP